MTINEQQAIYWDRQPCNVKHSAAPVGSRQFFADTEQWKRVVEPDTPGFAELDRWRVKRVLEVGCGIGIDTIGFLRAGADVTVCDLSLYSLELTVLRAQNEGLSTPAIYCRDFEQGLPEIVAPFDLIYAFGVLNHTASPFTMLRHMRRVSPMGTCLKLMVYNRWSYKSLRMTLLGERTEAQPGIPCARTFSRAEIRRLVEQAGFRVTDIRACHLFPYRIRDYVEGRFVKTVGFRYMPRAIYRLLERLAGWHLLVNAEARWVNAEAR